MQKTLILLVLFLLLGGATYWFVQENEPVEDTFSNNPHTQFALENTDQIQRVFLADRIGNQALVEKNEKGQWIYTNKVTGKTYRANPGVVWTLLQTLKEVRVRQAVSRAAEENAVKSLAARGIKVEVYDKDKNKLRVFYIGAMTDGAMGNFINMEGSDDVYVAYIPKKPGTIDTRFATKEVDWRDKAVFRNNVSALEMVKVEYHDPIQHPYSFQINRLGEEEFEVLALDEKSNKYPQSAVNQSNVGVYLEEYDVKAAERILYDKVVRDSIIETPVFATISYKASYHNEPQSFRVYSLYNPTADRGDGLVGHRQKIQRYFVDIDKDNFFLAQHLVFRDLLWNYEYFFQKGAVYLQEDEVHVKGTFPELKDEDRGVK